MMPCIYCWSPVRPRTPRAHIFPESSFGDHPDLVLEHGEVCGRCNNRFSRLEAAFKDRLGLIPMIVGTGRGKRGPIKINAPGMSGVRDPGDPRISLNLGKRAWTTSDGRHVRPALKKGERIAFRGLGQRADGLHEFRFTHEMRVDEVFVRVLAKIGFETICLHRGSEYCADLRWHRVRRFIVDGEGAFVYAMRKETQSQAREGSFLTIPVGVSLVPLEVSVGTGPMVEEWIALVTIGTTFLLDMSPHNLLLRGLLRGPLREAEGMLVVNTCQGTPAGQP